MATILVADDEDQIRSLLSLVLASAGHRVLTAANGFEAIALFRSFSSSIDLVITDLVMPVMDGPELVRRIRQDWPATRIICMSGYADRSCPQGVTVVEKPFLPNQLRAIVEAALQRQPRIA